MNNNRVKILIIGKTGTGKSSFINYFLDKDVALTGYGKPITKEISSFTENFDGFDVEIFDTVGLESENFDEWKQNIISEIKSKNNDDDISQWFHTIFYCFSAGTARREEAEIEFIKELESSINQKIHIIITNCDNANLDEQKRAIVDEIKREIDSSLKSSQNIYEVCSVDKKKRSGEVCEKFGKEIIVESVFKLLWEDISFKVATSANDEIKKALIKVMDYMEEEMKKELRGKLGTAAVLKAAVNDAMEKEGGMDSLIESFEKRSDEVVNLLDENITKYKKSLTNRIAPLSKMYSRYYKLTTDRDMFFVFEKAFDQLEHFFDTFDDDDFLKKTKFGKIMETMDGDFEIETFADFVKCLGVVTDTLIGFESKFMEVIEVFCSEIRTYINNYDFITVLYNELMDFFYTAHKIETQTSNISSDRQKAKRLPNN